MDAGKVPKCLETLALVIHALLLIAKLSLDVKVIEGLNGE